MTKQGDKYEFLRSWGGMWGDEAYLTCYILLGEYESIPLLCGDEDDNKSSFYP